MELSVGFPDLFPVGEPVSVCVPELTPSIICSEFVRGVPGIVAVPELETAAELIIVTLFCAEMVSAAFGEGVALAAGADSIVLCATWDCVGVLFEGGDSAIVGASDDGEGICS